MARSDLLLSLVKAGAKGDPSRFRRVVEALVVDERAKQHHALADKLIAAVATSSTSSTPIESATPTSTSSPTIEDLIARRQPERSLADLVLPESVREECSELIEEQHRSDLLRSYGLEPRHRVMLVGPPGNGKTSLAEAIADGLMLPLLTVRYDGLISSFLGETAQKLRTVFDYARRQHCVLFFDEFDALGKERGDEHETGEIKRVVNTLLLQIDDLPSHVVVVVATNHPELIDRAAWRRFQLRLELPVPNRQMLERWFERFKARQGQDIGLAPRTLADKLLGLSFAQVEDFALDVRRRQVMEMPDANLRQIVLERLKLWSASYSFSPRKAGKNAKTRSTHPTVSAARNGSTKNRKRRSK